MPAFYDCEFCGETVDINDPDLERTHQQWRCYACGRWNDRVDDAPSAAPAR